MKLGVHEDVVNALHAKGFKEAFAVQAAVLQLLLPGPSQSPGDILVSTATGYGKTLSYVLSMLEDISKSTVTRLRGLIVMPMREPAPQAGEVCDVCAAAFSSMSRKRVKVGTVVGKRDFRSGTSFLDGTGVTVRSSRVQAATAMAQRQVGEF